MKIRAAFVLDSVAQKNGQMPCLVSAVDEYTEDNWGYTPDFYKEGIQGNTSEGDLVREIFIEVPDNAVVTLFKTPTVEGNVQQ